MKSILLMRHGKSDWSGEKVQDYDRPLKIRGKTDSTNSGEFLKEISFIPDIIISSPALRASQTAESVSKGVGYKGEILWKKEIYFGGVTEIEKIILGISEDHKSLMLIGHNPSLQDLLSELTGIPQISLRFSSAAMAFLEADIDSWKNLRKNCCILRWLVAPKILGALVTNKYK